LVKAFNSNSSPNWTTVVGNVVSGGLIVPGTITANTIAANQIFVVDLASTNATVGNAASPGYWLQTSSGNARFAGNTSIGNNLTVGANAVIGGNLTVGANASIASNLTIGDNLTVANLITTKKELEESKQTIKLLTENAIKLIERKQTLGKSSEDYSDEQILKDDIFEEAKQAGATEISPITLRDWGDYVGYIWASSGVIFFYTLLKEIYV
jgi:carbonic anhydrase/acetyltransferase-like protein (isoleucine patch superfamily)